MRIKYILSQSLVLFIALSSALWSTLHSDLFTVEPSGKLSAVIAFGGMSKGDPACDLVIAWAFLEGKAHDNFIKEKRYLVSCLGFMESHI